MKKLIITATALIAGLAVNASTVDWSANCSWVADIEGDDGTPYHGNLVYFVDSTKIAATDFITALGNTEVGGAKAFENAFAQTGTIESDGDYEGSFAFNGTGLNGYTTEDGEFVKGYAVILDTDNLADAKYAYVYQFDEKKVSDAVLKSGATFSADEMYLGTAGGAGWTSIAAQSVPEPTSGLLLLLGVAGLALRRRRA